MASVEHKRKNWVGKGTGPSHDGLSDAGLEVWPQRWCRHGDLKQEGNSIGEYFPSSVAVDILGR